MQALVTDENDRNSSNLFQDKEQEETELQGSSPPRNSGSLFSINAVLPPPTPSSSTKIKKCVLAKQNELLDRACAYLSEPTTNCSNPIALEWAETLDRLDKNQRLFAKKAINDILFEAELGNLNRHSVQINMQYVPNNSHTAHFRQPSTGTISKLLKYDDCSRIFI